MKLNLKQILWVVGSLTFIALPLALVVTGAWERYFSSQLIPLGFVVLVLLALLVWTRTPTRK